MKQPACEDPELDRLLISEEIMEDPYPIYRRLREKAPVFWSENWNAWVLSRYDDVAASLKDKANLSNENRQGLLFNGMNALERTTLAPLQHYFAQKDVIGSDPPDHTRMRALVQKAFTAGRVASLAPRIRDLAENMLGATAGLGRFDFIAEVAHPLPVVLIAEMLGAPPEDRSRFRRWSADILGFQGTGQTTFGLAMTSQASLMEMFDYMNRLIEIRRTDPRDDLITALALAEDAGQRFTRDELLATCNTILTAGHETTTNLIGNLVHLLLADPERWQGLKAEPGLISAAVEEALRFEAPKQRNFRRIKKTHEFAGASFREGEMVFQLIGSANRDPNKFEQPDRFDLRRSQNDHLSLGSGIHFCLGAPLARMEARIVLETMLRTLPDCRLAAGRRLWQERVQFRGPRELWIETAG